MRGRCLFWEGCSVKSSTKYSSSAASGMKIAATERGYRCGGMVGCFCASFSFSSVISFDKIGSLQRKVALILLFAFQILRLKAHLK